MAGSLTKENIKWLYRKIFLIRRAEQAIQKDYFKDEMKTPVHLGIGGEAISVGVRFCLTEKDRIFATYRNHAIYLACSDDTDGFFGEMFGRITGCAQGKAGSMHLSCPEYGLIATSAVVGTTIPVAVGSALAQKFQNQNNISVVFFGDGAVEEGVFYESLNFATLKKLPVLFVIENNDLAIHSHRQHREGFKSIKNLIEAFKCHFEEGDGTDIAEVTTKTKSVLFNMHSDTRPGVLLFHYHRFLEHVGPLEDYQFGYRVKPENLELRFDPLIKVLKLAQEVGVASAELKNIETEVNEKIDLSVNKARGAANPQPEELYKDVIKD